MPEEAPGQQDDQAQDQPQLLAGKYKDTDELAKGIREVGAKLGIPIPEGANLVGEGGLYGTTESAVEAYQSMVKKMHPGPKPKDTGKPTINEVELDLTKDTVATHAQPIDYNNLLAESRIDPDEAAKAYDETGKLKQYEYDRVRKYLKSRMPGQEFPNEIIDGLVKGSLESHKHRKGVQDGLKQRAVDDLGSAEKWNNLTEWAKQNYQPEVLESITKMLFNPATFDQGLRILKRDHAEAIGSSGDAGVIAGTPATGTAGVQDFRDRVEFNKWMKKFDFNVDKMNEAEKETWLRNKQKLGI